MAIQSIIKEKFIDVSSKSSYCFEIIPQGKAQYRYFNCTLTNYGQIYQIPSNANVLLGEEACTVEDNKINISFDDSTLDTGLNKFKVCIYLDGALLYDFDFNVFIVGKE